MEWLHEITCKQSITACLVLTLLFRLLFNISSATRRRRRLPFPPGPTPLPLIGNMLMMSQLSHRGFAKLAERYGGLFRFRLGALHYFVVSSPEIAQQVLQVQDSAFSNRPATIAVDYLTYNRRDLAFAQCGPYWRQMRKLFVVKLFSRKHAKSWVFVREGVDAAVRSIAEGSAVGIRKLAFDLTSYTILRAAFGKCDSGSREEYVPIVEEISKLFGVFNVGDFIPWLWWVDLRGIHKRLKVARRMLDRFLDRIIDEHMAMKGKEDDAASDGADMVTDMLAFLEESDRNHGQGDELHGKLRLSRTEIKAVVMDVMFGGTETVAAVLEWAMADLLANPEDMRRVQEELAAVVGHDRKVGEGDLENLSYLKCAIKETLRLHPPFPLLHHQTAKDCELAGYSVPAGSPVMINVWAIGRDKRAWKGDPEAYRPSRFAAGGEAAAMDFKGNCFELLPFGSGRRSCPGMQLAVQTLMLAMAQLVHCFTWTLPDGMKASEVDMGDVFGLTAPRAVPLVAVPTRRVSCPL